jgi:adenine-specific DNA-methyltransferase
MKFKRNHLKSDYSKAKAPQVFDDLIKNIKAKLIVVSYNNTYSAKSTASNNKISEEELVETLNKKGKVTKREIDYKFFNAGKTDLKNHKEFIFTCEVTK